MFTNGNGNGGDDAKRMATLTKTMQEVKGMNGQTLLVNEQNACSLVNRQCDPSPSQDKQSCIEIGWITVMGDGQDAD